MKRFIEGKTVRKTIYVQDRLGELGGGMKGIFSRRLEIPLLPAARNPQPADLAGVPLTAY